MDDNSTFDLNENIIDEVYVYHIVKNNWSKGTALPDKLVYAAATEFQGNTVFLLLVDMQFLKNTKTILHFICHLQLFSYPVKCHSTFKEIKTCKLGVDRTNG